MGTTAPLKRPPGPKSLPFIGNILDFRRDPAGFITHCARTYGDVVHMRIAGEHVYLLNHPELIREVLVAQNKSFKKSRALELAKELLGEGLLTSESDFHRRQRRLMAPAFQRQRLDQYGRIMIDLTERSIGRWSDGSHIDAHHEMMRLTLAIVARTLLDADVEDDAEDVGEAVSDALGLFERITNPAARLLRYLPLPSTRRFFRAKERLDRVIYRIIAEHREKHHEDLLNILLEAQDTEEGTGGMTDKQIRDEALTIFIAGHETTANLLSWSWYLLSQHPEAEKRFHDELDHVLRGNKPAPEDAKRLPYTDAVIHEALRLYPPAWIIGRRALVDVDLGGYHIPAGTLIMMSQWVMHRDARYYPEPERFRPERWLDSKNENIPKFAFFPFGGGPRQCIGDQFAWMEAALVLAETGRKWRLELAETQPVVIQPQITLRPRGGLKMTVHKR